jgi:hypothetical protein
MVGVPFIAKVDNTLVTATLDGWQLCWLSGHQNDLLEVDVP